MNDLIERIEAASGRDNELDCLIAVAVSNEPSARVAYMAGRRWYKKPGAGRIPFGGAFGAGAALGMIFQDRRYTSSLDDAMRLAPEGWTVSVTRYPDGRGSVEAWHPDFVHMIETAAASPALAVSAFALRARSDCLARYGEDIFGDGK